MIKTKTKKHWFFEKINVPNRFLARLFKKEKRYQTVLKRLNHKCYMTVNRFKTL